MKTLSAALVAAAIVLGGSTLRAADELGVKKVLSLNAAMKIAAGRPSASTTQRHVPAASIGREGCKACLSAGGWLE
jgi:hypothetical protein